MGWGAVVKQPTLAAIFPCRIRRWTNPDEEARGLLNGADPSLSELGGCFACSTLQLLVGFLFHCCLNLTIHGK